MYHVGVGAHEHDYETFLHQELQRRRRKEVGGDVCTTTEPFEAEGGFMWKCKSTERANHSHGLPCRCDAQSYFWGGARQATA